MSINKVIISGNLTRDPEVRATPGGMPVVSFGIAVNDRRRNSDGDWEDFPNFIDLTWFGTRAEKVAGYISKGSKVCVEGKLRWSQWEREGQKRQKVDVVVENIELMTKSGDNGGAAHSYSNYSSYDSPSVYDDEDIPF